MDESYENRSHKAAILIAEDSPTQAEMLSHYLSARGHNVTVTRNGKLALVAALKRKPAVVITDVVMPEMDGYSLCRHIKSSPILNDVPVVLLTSLSRPQDIVKGLECGADSFIRKPYEEKYLLSQVDYILTNRELRRTERLQGGGAIGVWRPIALYHRGEAADSRSIDLHLRRRNPDQQRTRTQTA